MLYNRDISFIIKNNKKYYMKIFKDELQFLSG